MRESLVLVVGGLAIGLAIAIGASRFVASLLFGVPAQDATTIVLAMLMMALVGAFAAPARARPRGASRQVDPMVALRYGVRSQKLSPGGTSNCRATRLAPLRIAAQRW